jgi:hypothetical protein
LEDIKLVERNFGEGFSRNAEILGQYFRRRMRKPIRDEERVIFRGLAVVETQEELAPIWSEPLQRMRQAGREVPKITRFHVGDGSPAHFIENRDPAISIRHKAPLGRQVPMHLPYAAGGEPHVDAGDGLGDREVGLCHLTRPAAVLDAFRHC